jgi:PAS domain S-box-containing protein
MTTSSFDERSAEVKEHERRAAVILDGMYQFVALLTPSGEILEVNRAALEGAGHQIQELRGTPFWTARWWQISEQTQEALQVAIRHAAAGEFVRYEVDIYGEQAGRVPITIDFSLQPIRGASGEVAYLLPEGRNITERKRAEEQVARQAQDLRVLNERLTEVDRLKTQFFANVSHEFRTPLTLMLGPLEDALANAHGRLPLGVAKDLAVSHRNALRLLKLVNTMLDFSRIEAGRIQASYQPTDLAALTAELASQFRSVCDKAGLRLIVECPPLPTSAQVYVDRDMWEKIVLNLMSNALKFTLAGHIDVRVDAADGHARLTVRDTGVGIPFDELPHMFERFHRVEDSRGRTYEGTGIGLALVQELVTLHGGTVRVDSVLGEGSTFTVTIPFGTDHLDPQRVGQAPEMASTAIAASAFVEEAWRWLPDESREPSEEPTVAPVLASADPDPRGGHPAGQSARILWADDNADMRAYVSRLLSGRFDVQAVADGHAALEAARAHLPDLVLSDVMMPRLDGFGLLRALRADPRLRDVPIILLSARAGEESRLDGLEAGADDYLIKPFSARELVARVETHVKMSRLRREADAACRESERRLSTLVSSLPGMAYRCRNDRHWTMEFVSTGVTEITGYTPEDLTSGRLHWAQLQHPDDVEWTWEAVQSAARDHRPFQFEYRIRHRDGSERWVWEQGQGVDHGADEPVAFEGFVADITARKRAEQALRESQAQLAAEAEALATLNQLSSRLWQMRNLQEGLEEMLAATIDMLGADGGMLQLLDDTRGVLRIVAQRGFTPDVLDDFHDVSAQDDSTGGRALRLGERLVVEDIETETPCAPSRPMIRAAGYRAVQSTPLIGRDGRGLGVISTHFTAEHRPSDPELHRLDLYARQAADFIERKGAEAARAMLAAIVESSDDAIISKGLDGIITSWNQSAERLFGYTAAEAVGQPITMLIPPERLEEEPRILEQLTRGERVDHFETIRMRKDGSRLDLSLTISPVKDAEGRIIGASKIARDITERKAAEQAVQQAQAALEQRVEERTALLALIQEVTRAANEAPNSAAALQVAVDRLCAYTGWPVGHVYLAMAPGAERWAPTALWHLDAPERFAAFQQATQRLECAAGEGLIGRVGTCGQPEWCVDVTTDPTFHRRHAAQETGLSTGVAWPILVGSEVVGMLEFYATEPLAPNPALLAAITPIGTQLGRAVERERASAQAQRQQEALLQQEKLAAMSTMLASVAHELNNPLTSIVLQAELLREDLRDSPLAEPATEITQAAARCERLVRQFLTLSRQHPPERTAVALNTLVAETVELLAYPLRVDNVAVHLHLDDQAPPLWGDPHQLQQVLLNLLTNAQQALRAAPGARDIICTTQYDPAQHRITLVVADTGPGIPAALHARIFEPFFTTKPPGVGTGLGLPLCRGIVETHGGTLGVASEVGHGATFRLTLPVGAVPEPTPDPTGSVEEAARRGYTILIVEDEVILATGLARLLRRDGHTVDLAANGHLALAKLDERAYDLILCDVRMPELDGPTLYWLLERQQPHLCSRVVFLTGDTLEPATQAFLEQSGAPCLTKPFRIAEARRIIWRTLEGV